LPPKIRLALLPEKSSNINKSRKKLLWVFAKARNLLLSSTHKSLKGVFAGFVTQWSHVFVTLELKSQTG
jgi:hypothetical protein